jgi:pectinesterase
MKMMKVRNSSAARALSVVGLAFAGVVVSSSAASAQRVARAAVIAENPIALERRDETIELSWADVLHYCPGAHPGNVRIVDASGNEIVSQLIDADANGTPELLIFQGSFWPSSKQQFFIEAAPSTLKAQSRAHVRHDEPRDDIAWESDRIAFRVYGEGLKKTSSAMSSSGLDIWVKSVHALVIEKWYGKGHDGYHVDTGEGADFFDVGETLGAGGEALWYADSLERADNFKAYKITADGPIRASFELRYDPWSGGGRTVSEVKRFSIDAGQNLYREESTFNSPGGGEITYAIGLVKRKGMTGTESKANEWAWLSGWGRVDPKNGGHGEMGDAVLLPRSRVTDWKETANHYLAISHAAPGVPVVHYIGAGWTASEDFPTPQSWWKYLDDFAARLAAPLKVSISSAATRSAGR